MNSYSVHARMKKTKIGIENLGKFDTKERALIEIMHALEDGAWKITIIANTRGKKPLKETGDAR